MSYARNTAVSAEREPDAVREPDQHDFGSARCKLGETAQPITIVIGNLSCKEKAKGKCSWIEARRFKMVAAHHCAISSLS